MVHTPVLEVEEVPVQVLVQVLDQVQEVRRIVAAALEAVVDIVDTEDTVVAVAVVVAWTGGSLQEEHLVVDTADDEENLQPNQDNHQHTSVEKNKHSKPHMPNPFPLNKIL